MLEVIVAVSFRSAVVVLLPSPWRHTACIAGVHCRTLLRSLVGFRSSVLHFFNVTVDDPVARVRSRTWLPWHSWLMVLVAVALLGSRWWLSWLTHGGSRWLTDFVAPESVFFDGSRVTWFAFFQLASAFPLLPGSPDFNCAAGVAGLLLRLDCRRRGRISPDLVATRSGSLLRWTLMRHRLVTCCVLYWLPRFHGHRPVDASGDSSSLTTPSTDR